MLPRITGMSPSPEPFCLAIYPSAFHSVMFNPVEPRLIATANSKEGVGLWDIRKPRRLDLRRLFGLSAIFQMFPPAGPFLTGLAGVVPLLASRGRHRQSAQLQPVSDSVVLSACLVCLLLNLSASSAFLPAPCCVTGGACPCRAP